MIKEALISWTILIALALALSPLQGQQLTNWGGDLFWDAVTEDINGDPATIAGYNLYKGGSGGPYNKLNSALITLTTFNDAAWALNDCYVVTAVKQGGIESASSVELCIVPPRAPLFLRVIQAIVEFFKRLWDWV